MNTFYRFEVKAVIHNSTGEANIKINKGALATITGIDSQNSPNAFFNEVVPCLVSTG